MNDPIDQKHNALALVLKFITILLYRPTCNRLSVNPVVVRNKRIQCSVRVLTRRMRVFPLPVLHTRWTISDLQRPGINRALDICGLIDSFTLNPLSFETSLENQLQSCTNCSKTHN